MAITVVGLGPGDPGQLTLAARDALGAATRLYLRTAIHPTTPAMKQWGLHWESFDPLYQSGESFETIYREIADRLLAAGREADIVYAVPGHPLVAEDAVRHLLAQDEVPVRVIAGLSALDALYARLALDPNQGLQVVDALALALRELRPDWPTLVLQVHSARVASDAKLSLMRAWPDEHPVTVVRAAGVPGEERVQVVPLFELDRVEGIDYLTSVYLPPAPARGMPRLVEIIRTLRAPGGCPWDREQTPASLRRFILEEAYETVEAIDRDDVDAIEEELGDLLLQVVLQAEIFDEAGEFDLADVADRLSEKMIRRHPHVFGETSVADAGEVLARWEEIKDVEKPKTSALDGVSTAMPAIVVAEKLQAKAAKVRFDWKDPYRVLEKLDEELGELREALDQQLGEAELRHELGDLLIASVNLARQLKLDPEEALREANARFVRRFQAMEALAGPGFAELPLSAMEQLWQEAKTRVG